MSSYLVEDIDQIKKSFDCISKYQRGQPDEQRLIFQEYVSILNGDHIRAIADASIFLRNELEEERKKDLELDVSSKDFLFLREERRRQASLKAREMEEESLGRKMLFPKEGGREDEMERITGTKNKEEIHVEGFSSGSTSIAEMNPSLAHLALDSAFVTELYEVNITIEQGWGVVLGAAIQTQPEEEDYHWSIVSEYEHTFDRTSTYLRAWMGKTEEGHSILDTISLFQLLNGEATPDVVLAAFHKNSYTLQTLEELRGIVRHMQEYKIPVTVRVGELFEKAFARCVKKEGAEKVYRFMVSECGLVPLTTRPFALLFNEKKNGDVLTALKYYEEMLDYGIPPESSTLRLLCTTCKQDDSFALAHFTTLSKAERFQTSPVATATTSSHPRQGGSGGGVVRSANPSSVVDSPPSPSSLTTSPGMRAGVERRIDDITTLNPSAGSGGLLSSPIRVPFRRDPVAFFVYRLVNLAYENGIFPSITRILQERLPNRRGSAGAYHPPSEGVLAIGSEGSRRGNDNGMVNMHRMTSNSAPDGEVSLLDAMRVLHRGEVEGNDLQHATVLVENIMLLFCRGVSTPVEDLVLPFHRSKAFYPPTRAARVGTPPSFPTIPVVSSISPFSSSLPLANLNGGSGDGGAEGVDSAGGSRHTRQISTGIKGGSDGHKKGGRKTGELVMENAFNFHFDDDNEELLKPLEEEDETLSPLEGTDHATLHSAAKGELDEKKERERRGREKLLAISEAVGKSGDGGHATSPCTAAFASGTPPSSLPPYSSHSLPRTPSGMATISQEVNYLLQVMNEHCNWEFEDYRLFFNIQSWQAKCTDTRLLEVTEALVFYHAGRTRERMAAIDEKLSASAHESNRSRHHDSLGAVAGEDDGDHIWVTPVACRVCASLIEHYAKCRNKTRMSELLKELLQQYYEFSEVYHLPWDAVDTYRYPPSISCKERSNKIDENGNDEHTDDDLGVDAIHDSEHMHNLPPQNGHGALSFEDELAESLHTGSSPYSNGNRRKKYRENLRYLYSSLPLVVQSWKNSDWALGIFTLSLVLNSFPVLSRMIRRILVYYERYMENTGGEGMGLEGGVGGTHGRAPTSVAGGDGSAGAASSNPLSTAVGAPSLIPAYICTIRELIECHWDREQILQSSLLVYGVERKSKVGTAQCKIGRTAMSEKDGYSPSLREELDEQEEANEEEKGVEHHVDCSSSLLDSLNTNRNSSSPRLGNEIRNEREMQDGVEMKDLNSLDPHHRPTASPTSTNSTVGGGNRDRGEWAGRTLDDYLHWALREIKLPRPAIDWYRKQLASICFTATESR